MQTKPNVHLVIPHTPYDYKTLLLDKPWSVMPFFGHRLIDQHYANLSLAGVKELWIHTSSDYPFNHESDGEFWGIQIRQVIDQCNIKKLIESRKNFNLQNNELLIPIDIILPPEVLKNVISDYSNHHIFYYDVDGTPIQIARLALQNSQDKHINAFINDHVVLNNIKKYHFEQIKLLKTPSTWVFHEKEIGSNHIGHHAHINSENVKNSLIGNYTTIEKNVYIENSIIGDYVYIEEGSQIINSIIFRKTKISNRIYAKNKIIGNNIVFDPLTECHIKTDQKDIISTS